MKERTKIATEEGKTRERRKEREMFEKSKNKRVGNRIGEGKNKEQEERARGG